MVRTEPCRAWWRNNQGEIKVGAQVDLAGGQLRTATGLVIRGQVRP